MPRREYQATDKEAARENLWYPLCESHYHAYCYDRQGQILTLVQIYWCGKINQLSRVTKGFLNLYFLSLHHFALCLSPFHGFSLGKPLASRVTVCMQHFKISCKEIKLQINGHLHSCVRCIKPGLIEIK